MFLLVWLGWTGAGSRTGDAHSPPCLSLPISFFFVWVRISLALRSGAREPSDGASDGGTGWRWAGPPPPPGGYGPPFSAGVPVLTPSVAPAWRHPGRVPTGVPARLLFFFFLPPPPSLPFWPSAAPAPGTPPHHRAVGARHGLWRGRRLWPRRRLVRFWPRTSTPSAAAPRRRGGTAAGVLSVLSGSPWGGVPPAPRSVSRASRRPCRAPLPARFAAARPPACTSARSRAAAAPPPPSARITTAARSRLSPPAARRRRAAIE